MAKKVLPSTKSLPLNVLPANALALIHEYSRPITPGNWKKRKWICVIDVYKELQKYKNKNNKYDKHYELYSRFIINIQRGMSFSNIYNTVTFMGITNAAEEIGISQQNLIKILKKS